MKSTFPLPKGSALRWASQQTRYLRDEGFGDAVLHAVQPLFTRYAQTGEERHLEQAHLLLRGDR